MSHVTRGDSSPDDMRFADLVRLRETQQERRIEQLIAQNQQLQQQVQESLNQRAVSHALAAASGSDPNAASIAIASAAATLGSGGSETANLLAQLNEASLQSRLHGIVKDILDATLAQDRTAQRAAADRSEQRFTEMSNQIAELQAQLREEQKQKDALRREHTAHNLVLSSELDSLREEVQAALERSSARDSALLALQNAQKQATGAIEQMDEKFAEVTRLPTTLRSEAAHWEERLNKLAAAIEADRASVSTLRSETDARHEMQLHEVINEAKATVIRLSSSASDAADQIKNAQRQLDDSVRQAVAAVAQQLEAEIMAKLEEQSERQVQLQQRQVVEHQGLQQQINQSLADMKHAVDSSLMGMRRQYHDALQEQLRAVVQQAQEFEEKRRAECPIADADRIDLMVKELQGAFAIVESVTHRIVETPSLGEVTLRIGDIESKMEALSAFQHSVAKSIAELATQDPKLAFTVAIQADTDGQGALFAAGRERQSTVARVAQNLEEELSKAESAIQLSEARKILGRPAAAPRASPDNKPAAPLGAATRPPPSSSLTSVRQSMSEKEAALTRLQSILQAIQVQFHQLTEAESRSAGVRQSVSSGSNNTELRRMSEEIAKQKAAVYQHERQLVEQRNALWRELAQLRSQEEELMSAAGNRTA